MQVNASKDQTATCADPKGFVRGGPTVLVNARLVAL